VADENPLRRPAHPFGRYAFADPGIHTKLPLNAVAAGCEMKGQEHRLRPGVPFAFRSSNRAWSADHEPARIRAQSV